MVTGRQRGRPRATRAARAGHDGQWDVPGSRQDRPDDRLVRAKLLQIAISIGKSIEFYKRDIKLIILRNSGDEPGEPGGFLAKNNSRFGREVLQFEPIWR